MKKGSRPAVWESILKEFQKGKAINKKTFNDIINMLKEFETFLNSDDVVEGLKMFNEKYYADRFEVKVKKYPLNLEIILKKELGRVALPLIHLLYYAEFYEGIETVYIYDSGRYCMKILYIDPSFLDRRDGDRYMRELLEEAVYRFGILIGFLEHL